LGKLPASLAFYDPEVPFAEVLIIEKNKYTNQLNSIS